MQHNWNPRRKDELLAARNILNALITPANGNITFPFMNRIDSVAFDLKAYDEIVKFPMWLTKSKLYSSNASFGNHSSVFFQS